MFASVAERGSRFLMVDSIPMMRLSGEDLYLSAHPAIRIKMLMILNFLLVICFFLLGPKASHADTFTDALQKRLTFIFKDEELDKTNLSVEVFSLNTQQSLFRLNQDRALSPASAIKVLTALVALKKLGPDFTYKTEVYAHGPVVGGVLQGDLYLRGSGDPSLVTERLYLLVNDILRSDIKSVKGQIIVDDSTFDQVNVDPARINTDTDRAYNAQVGGLSFNYNTTTVYFRPGNTLGSHPRVFVEPDTGYVSVQNKATTGARGTKYSLVASRIKGDMGDNVVVTGSIPLGLNEQHSYFNITNPRVYAAQAMRWMFGARGFYISGAEVGRKPLPPGAKKIAELESPPLREIVVLMNKYSNNFIADTLVKTLGREVKGAPGTMEKGLEVIREEATRMGLNTAGFSLVSGSGLTRDNRITAQQFITLLNAAYLDFDVLPELLSSLPIAGRDGTLKSRMKGTSAYGRLRGKTGTIDGVSSLIGMVQSRGGELLSFAVIMNDSRKNAQNFRPWQNYFAQALADFNRKTPLAERPTALPETNESVMKDPALESTSGD